MTYTYDWATTATDEQLLAIIAEKHGEDSKAYASVREALGLAEIGEVSGGYALKLWSLWATAPVEA